MNYDKRNGDVVFYEADHKYVNLKDNTPYISVTTLIHNYTQPFDSEFWSGYKTLEKLIPADNWKIEKKFLLSTHVIDFSILDIYNISKKEFSNCQQEILDQWEKKKNDSCERGTKIHLQMENSFYSETSREKSLKRFKVGGKFDCIKDNTKLDLDKGVYPEYLIYYEDENLRLAGQIDLLIKDGNQIILGDWKGLPVDTEIPTLEGWSTIEEVKEGDIIFDMNGNPTKIIHKSEVHNNPCYKITFDNGDTIVADHEHRWNISFINISKTGEKYKTKVMTTEDIFNHLNNISSRTSYNIPKIINNKPLNLPNIALPIDPYVLGCWLGDGSKQCGVITNQTNNVLEEIQNRGYTLGKDISAEDRTSSYTILGLATELRKLGLLNNKHIPYIYQRSSYEQRLDLLRGLMDTDGYYNPTRKRFVMETSQEWQCYDFIKLLSSLGIKSTKFNIIKKLNGKEFSEYSINFSTLDLNPFLMRNQDIKFPSKDVCTYRNIDSVELVDSVPTQCLEVDSDTHTFLCTNKMIVTHNTNEKIDMESGYDTVAKRKATMTYPLNTLMDCNYFHYTLQLSTYAYMLQKLNPNFIISKLVLVHFDHKGNEVEYEIEYMKDMVELMLNHYKKQNELNKRKDKRKRIEY